MIHRYIAYAYRIRKPRVLSENDLALIRYKKQLRNARKNIHIEAVKYADEYEDLFLNHHKQEMLEKHRHNETTYRSQIISNGWRLSRNIETWKQRDEAKRERLEGFIHKQNLKTMNRDRILKILNYESEHFWYNPDNVEDRLVNDSILPDFAGSTQHYQLLTEQALAYQKLNFDELEVLENDQMSMRFKNKLLIPLYNQVITLIKKVKTNQFKNNQINYRSQVERINSLYKPEELKQQRNILLARVKKEYENIRTELLKKMEKTENRQQFIKQKIVEIRNLLYYWKKYAQVLNFSTVEIGLIRKKGQFDEKLSKVASRLAANEYSMKQEAQKEATFSHVQEANTEEEDDVDINSFLEANSEQQGQSKERVNINQQEISRLDDLLDSAEPSATQQIFKKQSASFVSDRQTLDLYWQLNSPMQNDISIPDSERFKQNSSVLIESWKKLTNDQELKKLLDEVGEIHVEQSALFWKIFNMH